MVKYGWLFKVNDDGTVTYLEEIELGEGTYLTYLSSHGSDAGIAITGETSGRGGKFHRIEFYTPKQNGEKYTLELEAEWTENYNLCNYELSDFALIGNYLFFRNNEILQVLNMSKNVSTAKDSRIVSAACTEEFAVQDGVLEKQGLLFVGGKSEIVVMKFFENTLKLKVLWRIPIDLGKDLKAGNTYWWPS